MCFLNTFARKFGGKVNLDFKVNKYISFSEQVTYTFSNGQGNINKGHEGVLANAIFFPRSATIFDYTKGGSPLYNNYGEALYHGTLPRWAAEERYKWIWRIPQPSGSF